MTKPGMICSDVLSGFKGIRHGFFTAQGGVSMPPYTSLNCGPLSGDAPAAVTENRARAAECLGISAQQLVSLKQVHSASVYYVKEAADFRSPPEGDALVTDRPGIGLGVLTADCAPVLLVDAQAGIIGAAHAGWKGALIGVCDAVVKAMCERGASRTRICAAIGPAIQPAHYEVQSDFQERMERESPIPAEAFFYRQPQRITFDNTAYIEARLRALGLMQIDCCREDTYSQPGRFFSFRRSVADDLGGYGRQISVIALAG